MAHSALITWARFNIFSALFNFRWAIECQDIFSSQSACHQTNTKISGEESPLKLEGTDEHIDEVL